jgi:hypothetical protein
MHMKKADSRNSPCRTSKDVVGAEIRVKQYHPVEAGEINESVDNVGGGDGAQGAGGQDWSAASTAGWNHEGVHQLPDQLLIV